MLTKLRSWTLNASCKTSHFSIAIENILFSKKVAKYATNAQKGLLLQAQTSNDAQHQPLNKNPKQKTSRRRRWSKVENLEVLLP